MKRMLAAILLLILPAAPGCNFLSGKLTAPQNVSTTESSIQLEPGADPGSTVTPSSAPTSAKTLDAPPGIRNLHQIVDSMSTVTGVPANDTSVRDYFATVRTRMSMNGRVDNVSPSMLLAITGLAGVFCKRTIEIERAVSDLSARTIFRNINFSRTPAFLTAEVRKALIDRYAEAFWRRSATEEEQQTLSTAIDEALVGRPSTSGELANALLVSCTAALSSLDFFTN